MACNLAAYRRPIQEEGETDFSDFCENLEDATIHIPELVEWSDNLIISPHDVDSERLYKKICKQWQVLVVQLNEWFASLHQHLQGP